MKPFAIVPVLLSCICTAVAWTTTNYWQTSLVTYYKPATTTSIAVWPTGAVSAISTNTSTSQFTSGGYTILLTVYDVFYAPSAAVCTRSGIKSCGPTPVLSRASGTITTSYWAPLLIANPRSCTKTSFEYTTASTVVLPSVWIDGIADQATQSVEALLVTTYVKTLSTNMGGQAVTTTVCDVYLRTDAVTGIPYLAESTILTECVDPRDYYCQAFSSAMTGGAGYVGTKTTCERSGQVYPPTVIAAGASSTTTGAAGAAATSSKSSAARAFAFSPVFGGSLVVPAFSVLLALIC